MPLPVSQAYQVIREGAEPARFACAECGEEYYCFPEPGEGIFGVVASCPHCGHIQPGMIATAKEERAKYFALIGIILFLVGIIVFGFAILPSLLGAHDDRGETQPRPVLLIVDCV